MINCATYDCQGKIVCCGDRLIPPYSNGNYQIEIVDINNDNVYCCEINLHVIRIMAFFNWINAGKPYVDGSKFWFMAEREFMKSCGFFYISKRNLLLSRLKKINGNDSCQIGIQII